MHPDRQSPTPAAASQPDARPLIDCLHHDIRTPMTAILGFADLIESDLREGRPPAELREAVRTIRRNGRHLLNVVTAILDISGLGGGTDVRAEPFGLEQLCREVLDAAVESAEKNRLGLRVVFMDGVPAVLRADPARLRLILSGLMSNALRYTDSGGIELRVHARHDPDGPGEVRFDVIDTGIGMTPELVERLTDPARHEGIEDQPAMGLGLHLCHATATLLGGRIEIRSQLGAGSRVTLILPVDPVGTHEATIPPGCVLPAHAEPHAVEFLPLAGARVLLVEDGPDNQTLLRFLLRRAGADVELAADGQEALEYADGLSDNFDLILMDMHMPRVDGYEATARLRRAGCELPIIALTAHARQGDRQRCLAAGCDDYITKPIDRASLVQTCKKWMLGDLQRV